MTRRICIGLLVCLGLVIQSNPGNAAEPTSVLDLVPKDAAGFVHLRVNDVWKHDAFAPVRDYLTKTEPTLLKEFDNRFGFLPADVETLTLIYPTFNRALLPPVIVVRTVKPYDKAKVVTALRCLSAAQWSDDWQHDRWDFGGRGRFGPPPTMPVPTPKTAPFRVDPPLPPAKELEPQCGPLEAAPDDDPQREGDPFAPRRPKPDLRASHYIVERAAAHLYCLDASTLVFVLNGHDGIDSGIMPFVIQLLRRQEKGLMNPALAQAAKSTAVIAIDSAAFGKTLPRKLDPDERNMLAPITSSKLAMLSLDLGAELKGTLTFQSDSADGAKKIEDALHGSIAALKRGIPEWRKDAKRSTLPELAVLLIDQIESAVNKLAVKQSDNVVTATTTLKPDEAFTAALKAGVAQVKVARERTISRNNLMEIGIAIHNYHDAMGRLPFPGITKGGAPLGPGNNNPNLSWRVAILPYIEQAQLYQQFKLDEPWDSEHNKRLIDKMPRVFAPVNGVKADKGHTFYQIFTGREAMKSGMSFAHVTDGTSNTLMVVEGGDSVPWTRPDDMLYDAKKPLPKLGAFFNGDFQAVMMDGSIRFIRRDINEKVLRALITVAGGEVVDGDGEK